MKCSLALLATAAGALSCEAFTAVPKSQVFTSRRSASILHVSAADEAAEEEQSFAPEQVSRRSFTSAAAAAAALSVGVAGMVTAPGYAEAYQAKIALDKQVKAIESANYMVRIVGCADGVGSGT